MAITTDCDHVFDVLTRGPFHAGEAADNEIEVHLSGCHECRRLAEALRPAVSLFHEAIDADEAEGLPAYHGAPHGDERKRNSLAVLPAAVAEAIGAATVRAEPRKAAPSRRSPGIWRCAGAALLGAAAGALICLGAFSSARGRHQPHDGPTATLAAAERFQPDEAGLAQLAAFNLPVSCFQRERVEPVAAALPNAALAAGHRFDCCTRCHAAHDAPRPRLDALAAVVNACTACHRL